MSDSIQYFSKCSSVAGSGIGALLLLLLSTVDEQAVPAFGPFALPSQPSLAGLATSPWRIVNTFLEAHNP
jgi:hypothetical protein